MPARKDLQNPVQLLKDLNMKPEKYWFSGGVKSALGLFQAMAKRVPAYQDFLKKNGVRAESIKTLADFQQIPPIDKDNYLRHYPLNELCWDGRLKESRWVFSATSGSTGEPFYFPRQGEQDWQYALTAELYLRNNFEIEKRSTLYINGFAMGVWIGGLFTYEAIKTLSERGDYRLSLINPGINKGEILKAVQKLGPHFDQIILGGYPPFVKDVIDAGAAEGLDWSRYRLGIIFSAEGFNETFRDYIIQKAGLRNPYLDTLNHYGIVDLGTVAHETPLSILIRSLAAKNSQVHQEIFNETHKTPTLAQYLPEMFFFEEKDNGLLCSAWSGLPLVRYDTKDRGEVITLNKMEERLRGAGLDLKKEIQQAGLGERVWNLPFVTVYERKDLSVTLYGLNIYPEAVRKVLQHESLEKTATGKFTLAVNQDEKQDQRFEVHVELKPGISAGPVLTRGVGDLVLKQLLLENSEYRAAYAEWKERVQPNIFLWPYEHPEYFKSGGKQNWIRK